MTRAVVAVAVVGLGLGSGVYADELQVREQFRAGYEARANGNPYLLSLENHVENHVIPCESGWNMDPPGDYLGLAQFDPGTWQKARRAPDSDYRDAWEAGYAVANWISMIDDPAGRAGWGCW